MRALTLYGGHLQVETDRPLPLFGRDEARVRVLRAGVCNTDLEIVRGYMRFEGVPGHEFVGRVEQCNDPALVGARVTGEINCGCGTCDWCVHGDSRHCAQRTVLGILGRDGAFADYLTLPVRNLHRVPDEVSDTHALFTEPLAAAFAITEQLHVRPVDRVTVLGDGKLGLLVAQVLAATSCDLLTVGRHERKLEILRRRGIPTSLLDTWKNLPRHTADIVVEATGSVEGFRLALDAVRPRGTIVLKTTCADELHMNLAPIVIDEVRVTGSRCGPFGPALRALARGVVDVDGLLDRTFPLDLAPQALCHAASPGALKVVLTTEPSH